MLNQIGALIVILMMLLTTGSKWRRLLQQPVQHQLRLQLQQLVLPVLPVQRLQLVRRRLQQLVQLQLRLQLQQLVQLHYP